MENTAYIQLVMKGENLTMADAENLAGMIGMAIQMASGGTGGGFTIEVGQITMQEARTDGE